MRKGSAKVWNLTEKSIPRQNTNHILLRLWYTWLTSDHPFDNLHVDCRKVKCPLAASTTAAQDRLDGGAATSPPVHLQGVFPSDAYPRSVQQGLPWQ
jgi:hypothetical protein